MTAMTLPDMQEVDAIMDDLESRRVLYPIPVHLAPAASLVRVPGGMVGELVLWLEPNPHGELWFSDKRIALIELIDSVVEDPNCALLASRKAFAEEDITILRAEPTDAAIQRWHTRWESLQPLEEIPVPLGAVC